MRENVGGADRAVRAVLGPALLGLGYARWGGGRGSPLGLLAMVGGALIAETAVTRVCPLNQLAGIDSARRFRDRLPQSAGRELVSPSPHW